MFETIKYQGKEWEVLRDCGTFYVAKVVDSDEVQNIPKGSDGTTDKKDGKERTEA